RKMGRPEDRPRLGRCVRRLHRGVPRVHRCRQGVCDRDAAEAEGCGGGGGVNISTQEEIALLEVFTNREPSPATVATVQALAERIAARMAERAALNEQAAKAPRRNR